MISIFYTAIAILMNTDLTIRAALTELTEFYYVKRSAEYLSESDDTCSINLPLESIDSNASNEEKITMFHLYMKYLKIYRPDIDETQCRDYFSNCILSLNDAQKRKTLFVSGSDSKKIPRFKYKKVKAVINADQTPNKFYKVVMGLKKKGWFYKRRSLDHKDGTKEIEFMLKAHFSSYDPHELATKNLDLIFVDWFSIFLE